MLFILIIKRDNFQSYSEIESTRLFEFDGGYV